jgi:hypothetical protein
MSKSDWLAPDPVQNRASFALEELPLIELWTLTKGF